MPFTAVIEPGFRVPIPPDWAKDLPVNSVVSLERTPEGILIRPLGPQPPRLTWDEVFATKLVIGSAAPDADDKELELTGDDYIF
jgi:hypothetical protein